MVSETAYMYTHENSLRESVVYSEVGQVIIAQKVRDIEVLVSDETGEEITLKQAESGKSGDSFQPKTKKQLYVLIPGYVEKLRFEKNSDGRPISRIKGPIDKSERSGLEKKIREYGYSGEILYREAEDFY